MYFNTNGLLEIFQVNACHHRQAAGRIQSINKKGVEKIASHQVMLNEALTGEKQIIKAGAAAFSKERHSFFITIIAPEGK